MCLYFIGYQLDLFKRPLELRVMSKEKTFTWIGAFLSLMIIVFICLSFFQSDMVQRTSPAVLEKTTIVSLSPKQIFGENRPFIFGLVDYNSNGYIDDTMFKIDVAIFGNDNGVPIEMIIPLVPCDTISNSLFLNQPPSFNNSLCILDDNIVIQGQRSDNFYEAIFFQLRICNNETDNVTCKSEEEIAIFLAGMSLYTIYPDYTYDIDNYDNPYSATFTTIIQPISFNNSIWYAEYIKQSTFVNDDFFLYSDPHKTILSLSDFLSISTYPIIQGQWTTFNNLDNPLTVNCFVSSNNAHYISRTYQKIQNALANCSGIASTLFIIGRILTEIHSRMTFLMIIIKNLYAFKTKTNKSKNQVRKVKKTKINKRKNYDNQETLKTLNSKRDQKEKYELKSPNKNEELMLKQIIKNQEDPIIESDNNEVNRNQKNILKGIIQNVEVNTNLEEKAVGKIGENKIKQKILSDRDYPQPEREDIIIPIFSSIIKGQEIKITGCDSIRMMNNSIKIQEGKIKDEEDKINHFEDYLKKHLEKTDNLNYQINISNLMIAKGKRFLKKKLTQEEQLFLKAEEVFYKEIDIVSMLKLQEIEKIKFVLLNPSQISLSKLLDKPVINCDGDNPNLMLQLSTTIIESGNIKRLKRKNPLLDIYKQMIRSENKSEVDCRILQLLDDEMKLYSD